MQYHPFGRACALPPSRRAESAVQGVSLMVMIAHSPAQNKHGFWKLKPRAHLRNSPPSLLIIGNNYLKQLAFGARANSPVPICRSSNYHISECSRCARRIMLFLKVVMVVSKSQYVWVKNSDAPEVSRAGVQGFSPAATERGPPGAAATGSPYPAAATERGPPGAAARAMEPLSQPMACAQALRLHEGPSPMVQQ